MKSRSTGFASRDMLTIFLNGKRKVENRKCRRILGIDPGFELVGWSIVDKAGPDFTVVEYGCIKTSRQLSLAERLSQITAELSGIIKKSGPAEAAVEQLFYFKNQKTVIAVAQARGAILVALNNQHLPIFEYTPLQVKQAVTGYGRADKKQIQEMVRLTCKMDHCPEPDDAADAIAIALCHGQTNHFNLK